MAGEITVALLIDKVQDLVAQRGISYPRLRSHLNGSIRELTELQVLLREVEDKRDGDQSIELLRNIYTADGIIETFCVESWLRRRRVKIQPFTFLISAWSQYVLSREMQKLRISFQKFSSLHSTNKQDHQPQKSKDVKGDRRPNIVLHGQEQPRGWKRMASFVEEPSDAVVLFDQQQELCELLLQNNRFPFTVSVVGVAGAGKTTLVQTVCNRVDIKRHFECIAWISVSKEHDVQDLLTSILSQLKIGNKRLQAESLREEISKFLTHKRCLIVLDDVHSSDVWYDVKFALPHSSNYSRVILTTRDPNLVRHFDPWISSCFQIRPLTDDESWAVFLKKVQRSEDSLRSSGLLSLKGKILRRCVGIPLAIVLLGGILSTKELSYDAWLRVIQQGYSTEERVSPHVYSTEESVTPQVYSNEERVSFSPDSRTVESLFQGRQLRCLEGGSLTKNKSHSFSQDAITEDRLPSFDMVAAGYEDLHSALKVCLLYLGLFPRSYQIPVRRLLQLWLAEGLAVPTSTAVENMRPEDLLEAYFEELVNRNMIEVAKWRLDGSPKRCRMPGMLYDTLSQDAVRKGFFHIHRMFDYEEEPQFNVQRVVEYLDIRSYPSTSPYIQHLRSYISFNYRKGDAPAHEVDKLLKKIVAKTGFGLLTVLDLENVYKPMLSETVGKLKRLKHLGLRWTFLDSVPESIGKLPCLETLDVKRTNITTLPISIWNLKNLRHLYMNDIHFDMSVWKPHDSSSVGNLQTVWGLLIGKNTSEISCLDRLRDLRKLGLTCHVSSLGAIIDWISKLRNLQSLRLRSINDFHEPSELKLRTMREHLKLSDMYLLGKLPVDVDMREILPKNLRVVTFSVSHLQEDPMPILGTLRHLNILRLFARSYIGKGMSSPPNGFPELRVLKLWMLEELENWNIGDDSMLSLRELEIRCCKRLKPPPELKQLVALQELTLTNMPEDFTTYVQANSNEKVFIKINKWDL